MLDFNASASLSGQIEALMDLALEQERDATPPRQYLGGSRLGVSCERQLQFEYAQAPEDPGKGFSGRLLRIFERGHQTEAMVAHHAEAKYPPVRGLKPTVDDPFAGLESDLPWETP